VALLEELGDGLASDPVALVLEPMDLDPEGLHALEMAELLEPLGKLLTLADDDLGLLDGLWRRRVDVVEDAGVRDLLDEVQDVVQAADQGVDVLTVEWRDEGRLQLVTDLMADLGSGVLGVKQLAG
jgi:hypothetical protein